MRMLRRLLSIALSALIAFSAVLLLRTFVFQLYLVEQQSMENTIAPGSIVIVDKLSIVTSPLERGDIVVFASPVCTHADAVRTTPATNPLVALLFGQSEYAPYIKRVIGVTGDTVEVKDRNVFLNGKLLTENYVNSTDGTLPIASPLSSDGGDNEVSSSVCLSSVTQTKWTIGPHEYFVMGDHRDVSLDSRAFGPIEQPSIIGRVYLRMSGSGGSGGFNRAPWDTQTTTDYGTLPGATPVPTLPPAAKP